MPIHLIAYTATAGDGTHETRIARIRSDRARPSWRDCALQAPGFTRGEYLGTEPEYTLFYAMRHGTRSRRLSAAGIARVGRSIMRLAARGHAWDIQVTDDAGNVVTYDFPCFRVWPDEDRTHR